MILVDIRLDRRKREAPHAAGVFRQGALSLAGSHRRDGAVDPNHFRVRLRTLAELGQLLLELRNLFQGQTLAEHRDRTGFRRGEAEGDAPVGRHLRLYLVPGMGHCQGGVGTDTFDKVAAIEQWVDTGRAPAQIVASRQTAGKVDCTRPLCPYPQVAKYKSTGSTDEAANFTCALP